MISEAEKSRAIALLKRRVAEDEIAEELDLPIMLIKDWKKELGFNDLVAVEANIHAVDTIMNDGGELVDDLEDRLKITLEETALDLAKAAVGPAISGDVMHAKAIQLCSDAVSKLYSTLVLKGNSTVKIDPGQTGGSAFAQLMKD